MKKKIIAVLCGLLVLMLGAGNAFGGTEMFTYEDMVFSMQVAAAFYPEETPELNGIVPRSYCLLSIENGEMLCYINLQGK